MRLEATNKNVRGGAKLAPPPSQVGLNKMGKESKDQIFSVLEN